MMGTLSLAARNLLRNRRRSITTVLAIIVGAQSILLFGGYSRNITYGLQTDYVKYGGHLEIQREGYYRYGSGNPVGYGIAQYEKIIAAVKSDSVLAPMLSVVTPTLQLGGVAGNFSAGVSRTVLARGIVVEDQNRMRQWNDYDFPVQPPPLALTGTSPDSAITGTGVARILQLCEPLDVRDCDLPPQAPGPAGGSLPADVAALAMGEVTESPGVDARIELLAASAGGAPNVASLNVVKAENQGMKELDDVFVGLHLSQAQRLVYGADDRQATAIVVQLQHTHQIPAAKARLEQLLREAFPSERLDVMTFDTLNPFYGQALALFATIFGFIATLIGAIVLFTVGNTMSMTVVERTVEIGTLRAMGLRRAGIRRLFICEGLLLGIVGAVLGVLIAMAISSLINYSGVTWTPPGRSPVRLIIRVWGENGLVFGSAAVLIGLAVISAWWPAHRAARMNIVAALRHA